MNRKAVFFDIDGTLFVQGKPMIESAVRAIRKLRENGHLAFICTGRSRIMIPQSPILDIGFDGIVGACGTYGEFGGRELFRYSMGEEQLAEMMSVFRKYHIMYILEGTEYIYYDEETVEDFGEDWYLQYVKDTIPHNFLPVQKVKKIDACKGSLHVKDFDPRPVYEHLKRNFEVMEHVFGVAEFVPRGFSKAGGIAEMCSKLGMDAVNTIAVGDSINDVDMLKFAGTGICMGNGSEPAKACADYITTDIFEDGIYRAMEHFGLL